MEKKKIFKWIINIILLILIVMSLVKYEKNKDIGIYDYCVQWDYNINREDLLWKCFNFKDQKPVCDWDIISYGIYGTQTLVIYDYYNYSNYEEYKCNKYVKSVDIDLGMPQIEG